MRNAPKIDKKIDKKINTIKILNSSINTSAIYLKFQQDVPKVHSYQCYKTGPILEFDQNWTFLAISAVMRNAPKID